MFRLVHIALHTMDALNFSGQQHGMAIIYWMIL
jgi:hypothetical protein